MSIPWKPDLCFWHSSVCKGQGVIYLSEMTARQFIVAWRACLSYGSLIADSRSSIFDFDVELQAYLDVWCVAECWNFLVVILSRTWALFCIIEFTFGQYENFSQISLFLFVGFLVVYFIVEVWVEVFLLVDFVFDDDEDDDDHVPQVAFRHEEYRTERIVCINLTGILVILLWGIGSPAWRCLLACFSCLVRYFI